MGWLKSSRTNWRKFWALSPVNRGVLLQAIVLFPCIALGLRLLSFKALCNLLERSLPAVAASSTWQRRAETIARLVQAAATHGVWRTNCLQRSLLLWWLLRRRGIAAELRIGVSRQTDHFEAHAWVECEGVVLGDRPDIHQTFAPFSEPIR